MKRIKFPEIHFLLFLFGGLLILSLSITCGGGGGSGSFLNDVEDSPSQRAWPYPEDHFWSGQDFGIKIVSSAFKYMLFPFNIHNFPHF